MQRVIGSDSAPMCVLRATLLVAALVMSGCQAAFPRALPGRWSLSEDARIAKQAKADSFPRPADVGLEEPTSTP
jgi:hypothetical protein